jgi:hypothetical protein
MFVPPLVDHNPAGSCDEAPLVLSRNATFVPSVESAGAVLICAPVWVTVL